MRNFEDRIIAEFSKDEVREHYKNHPGREDNTPIDGEFPTFNTCDHTVIDMSDLKSGGTDWMHTLVIKLPNGDFATVCVMRTGNNDGCFDIQYHGDAKTKVLGFKNGISNHIEGNLYAFVWNKK